MVRGTSLAYLGGQVSRNAELPELLFSSLHGVVAMDVFEERQPYSYVQGTGWELCKTEVREYF